MEIHSHGKYKIQSDGQDGGHIVKWLLVKT